VKKGKLPPNSQMMKRPLRFLVLLGWLTEKHEQKKHRIYSSRKPVHLKVEGLLGGRGETQCTSRGRVLFSLKQILSVVHEPATQIRENFALKVCGGTSYWGGTALTQYKPERNLIVVSLKGKMAISFLTFVRPCRTKPTNRKRRGRGLRLEKCVLADTTVWSGGCICSRPLILIQPLPEIEARRGDHTRTVLRL